jgi:hypothetical protein
MSFPCEYLGENQRYSIILGDLVYEPGDQPGDQVCSLDVKKTTDRKSHVRLLCEDREITESFHAWCNPQAYLPLYCTVVGKVTVTPLHNYLLVW